MARIASIPDELYDYDFDALLNREPHPRTRLRLLAMAHLQAGWSQTEIARALRKSNNTIQDWLNRFRRDGLEGLYEQPGRGKKPFLCPSQYNEFKTAVITLQNNRQGGRVQGKDIQQLLLEQFNIDYSLSSIYEVLHKAGLSWITSRSKHPNHSPDKQQAFKKTLKKRP
ncbi:IS630 family transposase [Spartinivicinus poritis]|uniref:IS630 family transposase n=1 Tax=Spartinivicinus poritis TaxID=2994640 RepID=A0ABT5UKV9_9GAMM|nr:IS630 family transposase [Spartinivicinus sp. A2-2]MDE1466018.1 IS630 family transposase [Spartinivicinus sp. A2-2]